MMSEEGRLRFDPWEVSGGRTKLRTVHLEQCKFTLRDKKLPPQDEAWVDQARTDPALYTLEAACHNGTLKNKAEFRTQPTTGTQGAAYMLKKKKPVAAPRHEVPPKPTIQTKQVPKVIRPMCERERAVSTEANTDSRSTAHVFCICEVSLAHVPWRPDTSRR